MFVLCFLYVFVVSVFMWRATFRSLSTGRACRARSGGVLYVCFLKIFDFQASGATRLAEEYPRFASEASEKNFESQYQTKKKYKSFVHAKTKK